MVLWGSVSRYDSKVATAPFMFPLSLCRLALDIASKALSAMSLGMRFTDYNLASSESISESV